MTIQARTTSSSQPIVPMPANISGKQMNHRIPLTNASKSRPQSKMANGGQKMAIKYRMVR
jgi:hypothetical protein